MDGSILQKIKKADKVTSLIDIIQESASPVTFYETLKGVFDKADEFQLKELNETFLIEYPKDQRLPSIIDILDENDIFSSRMVKVANTLKKAGAFKSDFYRRLVELVKEIDGIDPKPKYVAPEAPEKEAKPERVKSSTSRTPKEKVSKVISDNPWRLGSKGYAAHEVALKLTNDNKFFSMNELVELSNKSGLCPKPIDLSYIKSWIKDYHPDSKCNTGDYIISPAEGVEMMFTMIKLNKTG